MAQMDRRPLSLRTYGMAAPRLDNREPQTLTPPFEVTLPGFPGQLSLAETSQPCYDHPVGNCSGQK
jgi:hypothetical protein